jgi:hypothetical protein
VLAAAGDEDLLRLVIDPVLACEFLDDSRLSSGVPSTAVYFVKPLFIASIAASFTCSGVSKSGSPAARFRMLRPLARSSAALADTAKVGDGFIAWAR